MLVITMQTHVNFSAIASLFGAAEQSGRTYLYEYEVYDLIRLSGSETPPDYLVLPRNSRPEKEEIARFPGEMVVVKVISPYILHKSDVGGVRIVKKTLEDVLSVVRRMYYEIPAAFVEVVHRGKLLPSPDLREKSREALLNYIGDSIVGVVLCRYMPPDSTEFGNELLVSLRHTREFGMILSAGLGGTDTELYAASFRKGQAVVAASAEMVDGEEFFHLFKRTISYKKLAGLTRGGQRVVTDEQLLECFAAFIALGRWFSPCNAEAPFVIDELEVNPFAFSNYLMMPLDGLCRFSRPVAQVQDRPVWKIDRLLHPETIAIAGVSSRGVNIGRIILQNIVEMGFSRENITLVHPTVSHIETWETIADIGAMPHKVDLLILAVSSAVIPEMVEKILSFDLAYGVVLVPGGFGDGTTRAGGLAEMLGGTAAQTSGPQGRPVFLGGNSLGILSHPGGYDALFIPESKLPRKKGAHRRKSAFISQSGAYMITRMSKLSFLDPAYAVSIGNQADLTAGDFLTFFKDVAGLEVIAFYMEGFADLDGLQFCRAVQAAVAAGKEVIFYKAGRTAEGKTAMSGHTASIAGDYMVCESCISQAGAIVAETFSDFEGLLRLSTALHHKKINGDRLAAVSNAGYEAVGIADNIIGEDYSLRMAQFLETTAAQLEELAVQAGLGSLVTVANPMDVTPMATEDVYAEVVKILLEDDAVDVVVIAIVPLTPILHTLPDEQIKEESPGDAKGIVGRIVSLDAKSAKPLVMVVDSGSLYDHLADALQENGLPVFRSADQAVRVLGKYVRQRISLAKRQYRQK
jgi:acyl-CoA synthetase (NDP forming)